MNERSEPRRRRSRWRYVALPIGAVVLAAGVKLVTMYAFAAAGVDAYSGGRYGASETSFGRLDALNVVEPWRAHVGIGDARYRQGDLPGAEAAFTRALEIAPRRCDIRFNLAVTIEAQGDELYTELVAGDDRQRRADPAGTDEPPDPTERYVAALDVIEATECPSARADDAGHRLAAARERILTKLTTLDGSDPVREDADELTEAEAGDQERIENLQLRNQAGATQNERGRDRARAPTPGGQSNW